MEVKALFICIVLLLHCGETADQGLLHRAYTSWLTAGQPRPAADPAAKLALLVVKSFSPV